MPSACLVACCNSPRDTSYFKFPTDPILRKFWLDACKLTRPPPNLDFAKICANHFRPSDFKRDLYNELLGRKPRKILAVPQNVVPTQYLDMSKAESDRRAKLKEYGYTEEEIESDIRRKARGEPVDRRKGVALEFSDTESASSGSGELNSKNEDVTTDNSTRKRPRKQDLRSILRTPSIRKKQTIMKNRKSSSSSSSSLAEKECQTDFLLTIPSFFAKTISTQTDLVATPPYESRPITSCISIPESNDSSLKRQLDLMTEVRQKSELIRQLRKKIARQKKRITGLIQTSIHPKPLSQSARNEIFKSELLKKVSKAQTHFLLGGKTRGNHWNKDEIQKAIALKKLSRKTYRFIRKNNIFPLPGETTLRNWIKAGLNQDDVPDDVEDDEDEEREIVGQPRNDDDDEEEEDDDDDNDDDKGGKVVDTSSIEQLSSWTDVHDYAQLPIFHNKTDSNYALQDRSKEISFSDNVEIVIEPASVLVEIAPEEGTD